MDPWGVIQTPNPLIGCGLLAISSVIWPDMDPQGVIQGSKRGQNGSFWGSQNDPSDEWFWPFSPPKPGQEGSKKGPKWVILDPFWTPPGALLGPLFDPFWAVLGQIVRLASLNLGPRPGGVPEGVQNDPF